jgi:hypothetical protein
MKQGWGMKRLLAAALFAIFLSGAPAGAQVVDPKVENIGAKFMAALPGDWLAARGSWEYFDVTQCFKPGGICFGNNPSSPYGYPAFPNDGSSTPVSEFQMNADEAIVLIFRTPPEVRYFGFTQYIINMGQPPEGASPVPTFASLSDTVNNLQLGTTGSLTPGVQVFDQYSAVIWTGDLKTLATAKAKLIAAGLPATAINFIPLPVNLPIYPLRVGYGDGKDTFSMLMRAALPTVQANLDSYIKEKPFFVVKTGPAFSPPTMPAPVVGYAPETTGVTEDARLDQSLAALVKDIRSKYSGSFSLREQTVSYTSKTGWDCIAGNGTCAGDNHDALYSSEGSRVAVNDLQDFVIVVGVNHQKTGKALYMNHTIYDPKTITGIVSVSDPVLTTESALYHAGATSPNDSRVKRYRNLYAYIISYDCAGKQFCVEIPPPTVANPIGLPPGSPFIVVGRDYVDPRSGVRPDPNELVHSRFFIGSRKSVPAQALAVK